MFRGRRWQHAVESASGRIDDGDRGHRRFHCQLFEHEFFHVEPLSWQRDAVGEYQRVGHAEPVGHD